MAIADYSMSVALLLGIGDPRKEREWRNYVKLGFTKEHVPDLIRMALDEDLHWADSESKEVWSPIHAWRTLGQLRAQDAIEPLLALFQRIDEDDDDWVGEELPRVYGMFGPDAIPALANYLAESTNGLWARVGASNGLEEIAKQHPSSRAECVSAISRQLERFSETDPVLNGCLVDDLLELKAVESAPIMERAFHSKRVDISMAGDWEDVQIEFGMKKERTTPRARTQLDDAMDKLGELLHSIVTNRLDPKSGQSNLTDDVIYRMMASGDLKPPQNTKSSKPKKKK